MNSFFSPRICRPGSSFGQIAQRQLTANEAAVALRPFYFLVHPDRFAQLPKIRDQNEKSLQIFNGYLNDLYPSQPILSSNRPIEISFSIHNRETKEIEDVKISLSGTDPHRIVTQALEKCRLPTKNLPRFTIRSKSPPVHSNWNPPEDLMAMYLRKKRKDPPANDIFARLNGKREQAIRMSKDHEITKITMKDDIDELKWKTGLRDVLWQMDWTETHMRRCVQGVLRLLKQAGPEMKEIILTALYKSTLRFGRGSFVCCDGSLQFAADHVPEQWQKVCEEAAVRRAQLPNLHAMTAKLKELLPGSIILTPNHRGLAQTIQQMHTLIVRIENREPSLKKKLKKYTDGAVIEVMTSYDELNLGVDGRLCIPCNVDVTALLEFLISKAFEGKNLQETVNVALKELEQEASIVSSELGFSCLDWEGGLPIDGVLKSLRRLRTINQQTRDLLKGLHVRFSSNSTVSIVGDGKIMIPLNWV
ncbi:unnamed protein product, partial [Mesorhabditis belari]|uniref:T-cell activation inhibitor, mitochondrial n=1 Tax=Mesorhabditis belari TaxID=2138241 RepID=A0AAF3FME9_9BILA